MWTGARFLHLFLPISCKEQPFYLHMYMKNYLLHMNENDFYEIVWKSLYGRIIYFLANQHALFWRLKGEDLLWSQTVSWSLPLMNFGLKLLKSSCTLKLWPSITIFYNLHRPSESNSRFNQQRAKEKIFHCCNWIMDMTFKKNSSRWSDPLKPFSISCFRFHVWSYQIQTSHDEFIRQKKRSRSLAK